MKKIGFVWLAFSLILAAFLIKSLLVDEDKSNFLIGETSYGHYQIEMACEACHTSAFGGEEVLQNACVGCHQEQLDEMHDSHPKKKFTDPRNADRLAVVDARYCVACHKEHHPEQTDSMGVSLPSDYCFHCHQDVADDRESHKGIAFDSCANSGCHNYHDNRALYEDFLVKHAKDPWLKMMGDIQSLPKANASKEKLLEKKTWGSDYSASAITLNQQKIQAHPEALEKFLADEHASAGLLCIDCHLDSRDKADSNLAVDENQWIVKPKLDQCQTCHADETESYLQSKHGMRLAQSSSAMTGAQSQYLDFHENAEHREQGCNSCHSAHEFFRQQAATNSCLNCHADEHSLNFNQSKHAAVVANSEGDLMSCATCHMPTHKQTVNGKTVYAVEHNQSKNLRPNDKMIRSVCMNCHGLPFSIDALADELLIKHNFNAQPSVKVPSVEWAESRNK